MWRKEEKYAFLDTTGSVTNVKWRTLTPDARHNWLRNDTDEEFAGFMPIASRDRKAETGLPAIFRAYSMGVSTNRDGVVYDFDRRRLARRVEQFIDDYNAEVERYARKRRPKDIDKFVDYERVKWSETLKRHLAEGTKATFAEGRIREAFYRPFTALALYYDDVLVDRPGMFKAVCPKVETDNRVLCCTNHSQIPFSAQMTKGIPDAAVGGRGGQCFPLYTYSEDGRERWENVTVEARRCFREHYADGRITALEVFHYTYAVLHHPTYRARYADNLKRELARIPLAGRKGNDAGVFRTFAKAGQALADLHVRYELQPEYPLRRIENKDVPLDWRVEGMRLSKDRTSLRYNDFLTLGGIPKEVFDYTVGNRSALEWVIDQYRVTRDEHGEIGSDPNRLDDEQYIVRLIGQVVTVSVETTRIVGSLPPLGFE